MSSAVPPTDRPRPRTILRPADVITQAHWPAQSSIASVHVVRIGGAGMSAVARLALEAGLRVSGSDSQDGQFIGPLREAGARIGIGFDAALLADDVDVVVVSTAVRADNPEVIAARERGIPVVHRAAALAGLLAGCELLAVAGTHGKTSVTGMTVAALRGADLDPAWALGAAVRDLGRNAGFGEQPLAVVEADESDGSFLAFAPEVLVVTNLEPDHLDFHGDPATLTAAFDALAGQLRPGGTLVVCADDPGARALGERAASRGIQVETFGSDAPADWRVDAEDATGTGTEVEYSGPHGTVRLQLAVAGHHNVLNALAALAASSALVAHAGLAQLGAGLSTFTGASRRFDLAGVAGGVRVVDDYAHHPREVAATIAAARGIVEAQPGGGRVLTVFQPHLFSRTRAFAAEFATALAAADRSWVLPVYAAREDPDPEVDAGTIVAHAPQGRMVAVAEGTEVAAQVAAAAHPGDLLLMLGAGDIVEVTPSVLTALEAREGSR